MAKVPLTKAGVQTKLSELYALPQKDLDAEALEVATDFKNWIEKTFELSADEKHYLTTATDEFTRFLGSILYPGIRNRLPIKFKPAKTVRAAKRFETKTTYDFNFNWTDKSLLHETDIALEIYYE